MKKYIELDAVLQIIETRNTHQNEVRKAIDALPSICPEEVVKETIEEIKNGIDPGHVTMLSARATLEELLQKFKS